MRIGQGGAQIGHDGAAAIGHGEPLLPLVCLVRDDDFRHALRGRLGIGRIVAQIGFEADRVAEARPELVFQRRRGDDFSVPRAVESVARRAAGYQIGAIARPLAGTKGVTDGQYMNVKRLSAIAISRCRPTLVLRRSSSASRMLMTAG